MCQIRHQDVQSSDASTPGLNPQRTAPSEVQILTEKAEKAACDARQNARTAVEKKSELAGGLDANLLAIDEKLSIDQATRRGKIKDIGLPACESCIVISKPKPATAAPAPPRPSDRLAELRAVLGRAETAVVAAAAEHVAAQRVVERDEAAHARCIGIGDKLRVAQQREIGRLTVCCYGLTNESKRQAAIEAHATEQCALKGKARIEHEEQEAAALAEVIARHEAEWSEWKAEADKRHEALKEKRYACLDTKSKHEHLDY